MFAAVASDERGFPPEEYESWEIQLNGAQAPLVVSVFPGCAQSVEVGALLETVAFELRVVARAPSGFLWNPIIFLQFSQFSRVEVVPLPSFNPAARIASNRRFGPCRKPFGSQRR